MAIIERTRASQKKGETKMENIKKLIDLKEFNKAAEMLRDQGIKYQREDSGVVYSEGRIMERHVIKAVDENGEWIWDFVCSYGTYGSEQGLLEYWSKSLSDAGDDPRGWLTAEEVLQLIKDGV